MKKIQITEARKIAERIGAEQVVVIAFTADDFAITSYGVTKAKCAEAGRWVDRLCDDLSGGKLSPPMPPRPAQSMKERLEQSAPISHREYPDGRIPD